MHKSNNMTGGFAMICDKQGKITDIVKDHMNIKKNNPLGKHFIHLVDSGSRSKAMDFLFGIEAEEVTFDHQLNVWIGDVVKTLSFVGIKMKDQIMIIAANNQNELIAFSQNLQEINNEQANTIRRLMKEKAEQQQADDTRQNNSYDDLTALNNELINLQRELSKKNAELERLNALKNQFLGMAAHDLRNPLAIIYTHSKFLIDRTSDMLPSNYIKFLNNIITTSEFMLRLVEDLLDVSKIESGKLELNQELFNLVDLATKNVALNQSLADKKNVKLHLEYPSDHIMMKGDWHKLEQVFNNLLNNAIKFSPSGQDIRMDIEAEDDRVKVSVADHGPGISADRQKDIFQPFQQNSTPGADGEIGSGLGLSIVKKIVEGHQGEIWVESEEGNGAVFHFTLPLLEMKRAQLKEDQEKKTGKANDWKKSTLLIVEDDHSSQRLMEEMLRPYSGKIISCSFGNEALEVFKKELDIDLVLIDILLPDTDGRMVIKKIRESNTQIPIFAQTALDKEKDRRSILEAGADKYLTKPLNWDLLLRLLQQYLEKD
jgi:two-component system, OmpR family, sensor kinase